MSAISLEQLFKERRLMLSTNPKRVDRFRVAFFNFPEETSGFLSKSVKSVSRPELTFEEERIKHRQEITRHKMAYDFEQMNMTFFDDENSVVSMILYAQVMRQLNKHSDIFGVSNPAPDQRDYKFDVKIEILNSIDEVVESYLIRRCFITGISHSEPVVVDEGENEITITIAYDDFDIGIFDQFLSMTGQN